MDTSPLRQSIRALVDAAGLVTAAGEPKGPPPQGEWNADQILAHVSLVNAMTLAAAHAVAAGARPSYDNRIAQDRWTIDTTVDSAGGTEGLCARLRNQADALGMLGDALLSQRDLDTRVPTLLVSNDAVMVDQPLPLRDLIVGLAEQEIPGHTRQLLALLD
jgi:hypothetical protein